MIKIPSVFCLLLLMMINCKKTGEISSTAKNKTVKNISQETLKVKEAVVEPETIPYPTGILSMDKVTINGKPILLSKKDFFSFNPKIDSTKKTLRECGNPFEWLDENWMRKTYGDKDELAGTFKNFDSKITEIYTHNLRFDTNDHLVLFDSGEAKGNKFTIVSHHISLDENTTIPQFQELFPAVKMEKYGEKNEIRFRLNLKKGFDDSFLFYFKNGKLHHYTLWWLLC